MKNKTIYTAIFSLITIMFLIYITCTQSPFAGIGKDPDIKPPTVEITSHNSNDVINGTITLRGEVKDDQRVNKVEVYYLTVVDGEQVENNLGTASLSDKQWELNINTTVFDDGSKVFRAKAFDKSGKTGAENITLIIDNYGPNIIINKPSTLLPSGENGYYNPFQVALVCIDTKPITDLTWDIVSIDDPTAKISGSITDTIEQNYTFILDPTSLNGSGAAFSKGNCIFSISGIDESGHKSKNPATVELHFDFTNDDPNIFVSTPDATNDIDAITVGSEITIAGQANDDDGVKEIEIWYKLESEPDINAITETLDYSGDPQTIQSYSKLLTGLADGTYVVKVRAKDIYDKLSEYTELYYFKVDSDFPVINITAPDYGSWQKGTINIVAEISVTAGTIDHVEIKVGESGTYTDIETTPQTSPYSFNETFNTVSEVPNGGEIRYYIRATDDGGNQTINSILFNVDNVLPNGAISMPESDNSGLNQIIQISGTATDEIGGGINGIIESVTLNIEGVGDITPDGLANWSYDFDSSAIANDSRDLTVIIKDIAGNENVLTTILNIDQAADIPEISVTNLDNGDKIFGMYTITGDASDDDAVKNIELRLRDSGDVLLDTFDPVGTTSWSYKFDTTLYSQGTYKLEYLVYDIYDTASTPAVINFEIDPDLPAILFTSHSENDAINSNTTVSGTVTKTTGTVSTIEIKLQGTSQTIDWTTTGLTTTGIGTANATYEYTVNTAAFGDGPIVIDIRAKDDIDKLNTFTRNLIIDTQEPAGSLTLPAVDAIFTGILVEIAGNCSDPVPSSGLFSSTILVDAEYVDNPGEIYHVIDGSAPEIITGSVSNWTYNWNVPTSQKDGLYKIILNVYDRANNSQSGTVEIDSIRLARYTPQFSNLYINSVPAADNMFLTESCNFTGHLADTNGNDSVSGVEKIEIYLSTNNTIETGTDTLIASNTWGTIEDEKDFDLNYTFTSTEQYIIYRAIDQVGGYTDYPLMVNIDYSPPTEDFKYSSRDYSPSTQSTNPGYSASYWVKLDANDDNDLSGATVQVKLGTTSGGDEIVGLNTYSIGDYFECDLRSQTTDPIYLWYKVKDKAGNETEAVLSLARDSSLPTISSTDLDDGYLNLAGLNVSGTATGGGQTVQTVKLSDVDEDELTTSNDASGTTSWTYTIPAPSEGDHSIVALVTADNGTNWYEEFDFTYDNTDPANTLSVMQIDGGRVDVNNLSGTVRFNGVYTDNFDDRYNPEDIVITLTIDGLDIVIPDINKIKNQDGSFNWSYDWDSETHSTFNVVKSGIEIYLTSEDKAGNSVIDTIADQNVVPYITHVTEVTGQVAGVYGYNSGTWSNLDDNKTYTYRRGSGDIRINGYNLDSTGDETITYTRNTSGGNTWTRGTDFTISQDSEYYYVDDLDLTWNVNELTNGSLKMTVYGIDSNEKDFYIIYNYNAPNGFADTEETDMVLDDSNNAMVVVQKHFQNVGSGTVSRNTGSGTRNYSVEYNGSGIYRLIEDSENTFNTTTLDMEDFLFHGYNRFWFVNVIKDLGTSTQTDGKFYLFTDDSENYEGPTKGLQLTGSDDFWEDLPYIHKHIGGYNPIWMPVNDWDTNPSPSDSTGSQYRNYWRMSAANNYDGNSDLFDWSVTWADLVAKNNIVYTIWYSQYDNKMHYRRLYNETNYSEKSPNNVSTGDASHNFNIPGKYPSITVDTNNYPVIACFNEDTGDAVIYAASNADPQNAGDFTVTTIDSTGVVGAYSDIQIDTSSGVHVVYQDTTNSTLKYFYAASTAALGSGTSIVIDNDSAPGFYCDLQLTPTGKPVVTYISYGYLGTGNAIRAMRFTGTGTNFTDEEEWERLTLPCENSITENKVRGYYVDAATDWLFGFGKSDRPEFFREKP